MELRVEQSPYKGAALAGTIDLGDLTVNRLGFGAMRLCGDSAWGRPRDRGHANRVLHRAVELGVNFIDTADSYGPETNESLISQALYPYPSGLVIATKGGLVRPNRRSWVQDGRPDHLRRAIEGSLQRLRLERIDLYQFHAPDPNVPFTESVGALADLQRLGKIRHRHFERHGCAAPAGALHHTNRVGSEHVQSAKPNQRRRTRRVRASWNCFSAVVSPRWQTRPKGTQDKASRLASRSHARSLIPCVAAR
jgi:aryl-alcohol dehydrogenase-like predicted oxidoreductase